MAMDQGLLKHIDKLKTLCRICGNPLKKGVTYDKTLFKDEIKLIYSIDVDTDLNEVHPPRICKKDSNVFYRFRKLDTVDVEAFRSTVPEAKYFQLHNHDDGNCELCFSAICKPKAGRPTKTKVYCSRTESTTSTDMDMMGPIGIPMENADATFELKEQIIGNEPPSSPASLLIRQMQVLLPKMDIPEKETFFKEMTQTLSPDDLSIMSYYVGKVQHEIIRQDSKLYGMLYKDAEAIANINMLDWLHNRNKATVSYILGAGNFGADIATLQNVQDKLLTVSRAVEQIYMVAAPTLISPVSFLLNVCSYSLSGSKHVVDMIGECTPGGKYKTVTNWLKNQGTSAPVIPDGDLINVFDNEQVIGRKNAIRPKSKATISIITNKGFVKTKSAEQIQGKQELKPPLLKNEATYSVSGRSVGDKSESTVENINAVMAVHTSRITKIVNEEIAMSSNRFTDMSNVHFEQLHHCIEEVIHDVMSDQQKQDQSFVDTIDKKIQIEAIAESTITCTQCGTLNEKRKRICGGCKGKDGLKDGREIKKHAEREDKRNTDKRTEVDFVKISFETTDENTTSVTEVDRYSHIHSNHNGSHAIVLTDPVFCNPNSIETVAMVLRKIGSENGIFRYGGNKRYWTFVCCDGLPFMICKKLKEEAVICTVGQCREKMLSKSECIAHQKKMHPDVEKCEFVYEFDWFYLRIGGGHYEINLIRGFF